MRIAQETLLRMDSSTTPFRDPQLWLARNRPKRANFNIFNELIAPVSAPSPPAEVAELISVMPISLEDLGSNLLFCCFTNVLPL